jgi:hypothetical protein
MYVVLLAILRGAIGGFVIGFLMLWLGPVFESEAGWTLNAVWNAGLAVEWGPLMLCTAIGAISWGWIVFRTETEIGQFFSLLGFVGKLFGSLFR